MLNIVLYMTCLARKRENDDNKEISSTEIRERDKSQVN